MRQREPVNTVGRESERHHVEGRDTLRPWCGEDLKPREADEDIDAGNELHEARHPEPPHAHGLLHFGRGLGVATQRLAAPDEIAGAQAKESNNYWNES